MTRPSLLLHQPDLIGHLPNKTRNQSAITGVGSVFARLIVYLLPNRESEVKKELGSVGINLLAIPRGWIEHEASLSPIGTYYGFSHNGTEEL
jgi:hypothetical protein